MKRREISQGQVFGDYQILCEIPWEPGLRIFAVKCLRCSEPRIVRGSNLFSGHSKGCPCWKTKHGQSTVKSHGTRTYRIWHGMISRATGVTDPRTKGFYKKIGVSEEWRSFENFFKDMGHPPTDEHSLDRKNNNLGYSKENCRWATAAEQARNTSKNINFIVDGKVTCLIDLCKIFNLNYSTVYDSNRRKYKNWRKTLDYFKVPKDVTHFGEGAEERFMQGD